MCRNPAFCVVNYKTHPYSVYLGFIIRISTNISQTDIRQCWITSYLFTVHFKTTVIIKWHVNQVIKQGGMVRLIPELNSSEMWSRLRGSVDDVSPSLRGVRGRFLWRFLWHKLVHPQLADIDRGGFRFQGYQQLVWVLRGSNTRLEGSVNIRKSK